MIRREQDVATRLRVAEEYASLVNAVHAHKELLFDYGHSLDKVGVGGWADGWNSREKKKKEPVFLSHRRRTHDCMNHRVCVTSSVPPV